MLPLKHNKHSKSQPKSIERMLPWADFLLKIASICALLGGGLWALYQFQLAGTTNWVINFEVTTELHPYHGDLRLLVVRIVAKNPRSTELDLNKPTCYYRLTVRGVPGALRPGAIVDTDTWKQVASVDLMPAEGMIFVPNAELEDTEVIVMPANTTVAIQIQLGGPDGDYVNTERVVSTGA
jgi:hypothetical protein